MSWDFAGFENMYGGPSFDFSNIPSFTQAPPVHTAPITAPNSALFDGGEAAHIGQSGSGARASSPSPQPFSNFGGSTPGPGMGGFSFPIDGFGGTKLDGSLPSLDGGPQAPDKGFDWNKALEAAMKALGFAGSLFGGGGGGQMEMPPLPSYQDFPAPPPAQPTGFGFTTVYPASVTAPQQTSQPRRTGSPESANFADLAAGQAPQYNANMLGMPLEDYLNLLRKGAL